uniref:Uncharacterized protein n=1 Tax=Avena sativa TaxID=4498 RepID=A0ACD5TB53_AVESA
MIRQHCNGLLLLGEEEARVLNPATREWARLPPPPPMCTPGMEDMYPLELADYMDCHDQYLVFDPTLSPPHYQVFLIKHVPWIPTPDSCHLVNPHIKEREWPPSTFVLLVFSSRTYQWEERPFLRQGEAARTIGYMLEAFPSDHPYAVYWRGALYILQYDLAIRIPLSSHKYQNGVYCALFDGRDSLRLQIWYLDEMCDQLSWILKCDVNLHPLLESICRKHGDGPPGVQCAKCVEDNISNATGTEVVLEHGRIKYSLLGFHPNEKIVSFHTPLGRVVAYHFDSSKIEDLGCLPMGPKDYIYLSLPYTPCRMSVFKQQVAGCHV